MRKYDKKLKIQKANILVEKRYLESKGLISESFYSPDGTPIGVNHKQQPIKEDGEPNKYDLTNEANMDSLISMILSYFGKEKTNSASIANDNKVIIYNDLIKKLMQISPASSLNNGKNGNEIYTNNPEMMTDYLNKFGVNNFTLIDSSGNPY